MSVELARSAPAQRPSRCQCRLPAQYLPTILVWSMMLAAFFQPRSGNPFTIPQAPSTWTWSHDASTPTSRVPQRWNW